MNILAFGDRAGRHMYDRGDWFPFGMVAGLVVLGALVALAVWLLTRNSRRPGAATTSASLPAPLPGVAGADAATDLARLRYARGEMTRDQYLQTVADLSGVPSAESAQQPQAPAGTDLGEVPTGEGG